MKVNIAGIMVDLDIDDGLKEKIERALHSEELKQVRRTRSTPLTISSLASDNRKVEIDTTICPHCGGTFITVRTQSQLALGYCDRCRDNLVMESGKVYGMFTGTIGYRKLVPVFITKEPQITASEPTALVPPQPDKPETYEIKRETTHFGAPDEAKWRTTLRELKEVSTNSRQHI